MDDDYQNALGNMDTREDLLDPDRVNALRAAFGSSATLKSGDELPPLYHWLYFWPMLNPKDMGEDGHQRGGAFLPKVHLPRRMWAGGEVCFLAPLYLGDSVSRVSTISRIEIKHGKSGKLVFVTLDHTLNSPRGVAIQERQDIVYREATAPFEPSNSEDVPIAMGTNAHEVMSILPDSKLLFRYSAVTMNSHRIHYDLPYARSEGYPEIVVHGPLQATLVASLFEAGVTTPLKRFKFRNLAPAFAGKPLSVCREGSQAWIEQAGKKTIEAEIDG